jgi:uncharacterized protein
MSRGLFDAEAVIRHLQLEWLPPEGGYFRSTYRSKSSSAIYYLVTPNEFSALHRLPQDEVFHFYRGDAVEMLQIHADGRAEILLLGTHLESGEVPQAVAPGGVWQGTRLIDGGRWALLGCTVAPPFEYALYEHGKRAELSRQFPQHRPLIEKFTRAE